MTVNQSIINNIIGFNNYNLIFSRKCFYDSLNKPINNINNEYPKENCIDYIYRKITRNPHPFHSDYYPNINEYTIDQIICEIKKRYMIKIRPSHTPSHQFLNANNSNKNSWKKNSIKDSNKISRISLTSRSISVSSSFRRQKNNSLVIMVMPKSNTNTEL